MAMFRLQITSIKRSAGQRATASAAYRAGERIRDERSGDLHNYSRRKDILHTEIFLPSKLDASQMGWAQDRATLWNAAELAETRRTSRVAREFQVSLPPELSAAERLSLARGFSRELADRYGAAVDLAVHDPRPGSDTRNFHAHLLTTTREVTPTGLGAKTGLDMSREVRARHGLPDHRQEYVEVRERWAHLTNEVLREANIEARVDHRTLAAQGIDREPQPRIPAQAFRIEKAGIRSEVAERLREGYRARVEERRQRATDRSRAEQASPPIEEGVAYPKNIQEIQRDAVKAWLRYRAEEANRTPGKTQEHERERDQVQHRDAKHEDKRELRREPEVNGNEEPAVVHSARDDYGL